MSAAIGNPVWQKCKSWLRSGELAATVMLSALVVTFTRNWAIFTNHPPFSTHLGGEYYNIAAALADGRGYSDPFGALSGPTAWMPPAFTFLLAALILLLKSKTLVAQAVVVLTGISWVVVGLIVFRIARKWTAMLSPFVALAFYAVWLWAFYAWIFVVTHDIWLIALEAALICAAFSRYVTEQRVKPWSWGLLGGLATLTSPTLAFAWLGLTLLMLWSARPERQRLLLALVMTAVLGAPWVARNALAFHRLIPTKSNAFYEAYAANYQDDDGIYDGALMAHPYNSVMMRYEYTQRGEMGFIDEHRDLFLASLQREPERYLRAVVNRLLAVTVNYVPFRTTPFNNGPDESVKSVLQRTVYALPFTMMLALLALRRRAPPLVAGLALFYALYLLPYVLTAFYPRYLLPLTPVLVMFMFFGLDRLAAMGLRQAPNRGEIPLDPLPHAPAPAGTR